MCIRDSPRPHAAGQGGPEIGVENRCEDRGLIDHIEGLWRQFQLQGVSGEDWNPGWQHAPGGLGAFGEKFIAHQSVRVESEAQEIQQIVAGAAADLEEVPGGDRCDAAIPDPPQQNPFTLLHGHIDRRIQQIVPAAADRRGPAGITVFDLVDFRGHVQAVSSASMKSLAKTR